MRPRRAPTPVDVRLLRGIELNEWGCWEWQGTLSADGYGRIGIGSRLDGLARTVPAHRLSYETFVGPIPPGLQVDHTCINPPCINPQHLTPMTAAENNALSRSVSATNARKTACGKCGGPLTDDPHARRVKRRCAPCRKEWQDAYNAIHNPLRSKKNG